jgi:putative DNA primase/helicase
LYTRRENPRILFLHSEQTASMSAGIATRVRVLDLAKHWPACPGGGDISDWLAAGHTREEFDALIEQASDFQTRDFAERQLNNGSGSNDEAEIRRLAGLSPLEYERQRKSACERLNLRVPILDKLVEAERQKAGAGDGKQGRPLNLPQPEPWPQSVDGVDILAETVEAITRYMVLPNGAADMIALWALHTHCFDCFEHSPRLAITSPEKQCGKTLSLDILACLVTRPLLTANATVSAIFRTIDTARPTLLIDEADTFLRDNDELRGVLNAGHRKGGMVTRTVGDDHEPRQFSAWAPAAIAMIGQLPDTLHDRSLNCRLRRRNPSERVESFRSDRADHLHVLARKMARFAADNEARLRGADPDMGALQNRVADNWRSLFALADAAGGAWS